ncbi:MAG TPA: PDZ domain-containing protein, partial [Candidatus Polarisedimenticolia bacterium]|nr:PDZ domain-containing protein [Candidatus Polarisedimenticolia bacterium]
RKKSMTATLGEAPRHLWGDGQGFHGFAPGDGEGFPGMRSMGMFSRTYLGVRVQGLTEELRSYFRAPRGRGVLVSRVEEDTPAGKAGLRAGDVIIAVDGKGIADRGDISQALEDKEPGDQVTVKIVRDGSEKTLEVEVAERPGPKGRRGSLALPGGEEGSFFEDNDDDHDFEALEPEGLPEDSRIEIEKALRQAHEAMSHQDIQRRVEIEKAMEEVMKHRHEIQRQIQQAMRQTELARIDQAEVGRQVRQAMELAREGIQRALEAAHLQEEEDASL